MTVDLVPENIQIEILLMKGAANLARCIRTSAIPDFVQCHPNWHYRHALTGDIFQRFPFSGVLNLFNPFRVQCSCLRLTQILGLVMGCCDLDSLQFATFYFPLTLTQLCSSKAVSHLHVALILACCHHNTINVDLSCKVSIGFSSTYHFRYKTLRLNILQLAEHFWHNWDAGFVSHKWVQLSVVPTLLMAILGAHFQEMAFSLLLHWCAFLPLSSFVKSTFLFGPFASASQFLLYCYTPERYLPSITFLSLLICGMFHRLSRPYSQ